MYPNKIKEKCPRCYKEKELAIFKYKSIRTTLCPECLKKYIYTIKKNDISWGREYDEICPICEKKTLSTYFKYKKFKSNMCLNCIEKYISTTITNKSDEEI